MKPKKFKCRSSMVGVIMTEPKLKTEVLSETAKTFLKNWIIENKYGRRKDFASKYTGKGNLTEQDGFQLIQDVLFKGTFLYKNQEYFENNFLTGNPDILVLDEVIDNKSSWVIFTFPFECKSIDKGYMYQLQSYMYLTGKKKARLCYTLNDTPFHLVENELKSWAWNNQVSFDEIPESIAYEIIKNHIYTREGLQQYSFVIGTHDTSDFIEIPFDKRIKSFSLVLDTEIITKISKRVKECDLWVQENWDNF